MGSPRAPEYVLIDSLDKQRGIDRRSDAVTVNRVTARSDREKRFEKIVGITSAVLVPPTLVINLLILWRPIHAAVYTVVLSGVAVGLLLRSSRMEA